MDKPGCLCPEEAFKVFWVIHGLDPDMRKHVLTRHAECIRCHHAHKDISEREMLRQRKALIASMRAVLPNVYNTYPFLKRYLAKKQQDSRPVRAFLF